jgi:hypothetical protein
MTTMFNTANGLPEKRIIENIYLFKDILEVLFVVIGDENEHVNAITTDENGVRHLEFFLRNVETKQRVFWHVPSLKLLFIMVLLQY